MAAPILQFKKGTTAPGSIFYAAEPAYDTTAKILYLGDAGGSGSGAGTAVASASATSAATAILRETAAGTSAGIILLEETGSGTDSVTIQVPALTASYTLTLPNTDGDASQVLQTDGNGALSWVDQTSGFSGFDLAANTGTAETVTSAATVTLTGGTGIDTSVAATNTVTIAIDGTVATLTGSQTLTNKTLTSPVISTISNTGTLTLPTTTGTVALTSDIPTDNASLANGAGYITASSTDTLTNKSIDGSSNTLTNIANASLTNSSITIGTDVISLGGTQTDLNGLTSVDVDNITIDGNTVTTSSGNLTLDSNSGTTTVDDNLVVSGNLTVSGTTTTVNTVTTTVEDRLFELGIVDGSAPSGETTWDTGVVFNYHNGTNALKSGVVWNDSEDAIEILSSLGTITGDTSTGVGNPTIASQVYAAVSLGSLYIGAASTATNEVIDSSKNVINVIIDGGTY